MWTKDNIPILVPADESDAQAVAEYRIRSADGKPAVLMADLDPWSEPQAEIASGLVPLVQIRVSDGGETFVETSSGWHCVSGWQNMKSLVPDWKPTSPSPLSSAASGSPSAGEGEGGDPAFGGGSEEGEDNGGSAGSCVVHARASQSMPDAALLLLVLAGAACCMVPAAGAAYRSLI